MRVGLINPYNIHKNFGGAEFVVRILQKGLEEKGIETEVIHASDGINNKFQILKTLSLLKAVKKKKNKIDVAHYHGLAGAVNKFLKLPSLNTCHGTVCGDIWSSGNFMPFHFKAYKRMVSWNLEKTGYESSDYAVSISEKTKQEIMKGYNIPESKIINVINGVDTSVFKPRNREESRRINNLPEHGKIVLATGTMDIGRKGFDLYADIMKKAKEKFTPVINGKIRPKAEHLKPKNAVVNYLKISELDQKLPTVYNSADVFIQTSRYEGCSISQLEAIASGLPCVTFNTGASAELIKNGKNGFVIPNYDTKQFAEKLDLILSDEKLRGKMGKESQKLRGKISYKKMTEEYIKIYKKLA